MCFNIQSERFPENSSKNTQEQISMQLWTYIVSQKI